VKEQEIRQIPLTALFAAVGIILPQFFHLLGLGSTFLPMFLPVMMGSMLLTWRFALALAVICPVVSWALTGMPPVAPPILPIVLAELIVISQIVSLLHVQLKKSYWAALITAIIADRLLLFVIAGWLAPVFGLDHPVFSIALVSAGIPGVILQLITIPLTMALLKKYYPQLLVR
jgi:hypothetical protein